MSDAIHLMFEDRVLGALRLHASRMLGSFVAIRRWQDTGDIFQSAMLGLVADWHKIEIKIESSMSMYSYGATRIRWTLLDLAAKFSCPSSWEANHQSWAGDPDSIASLTVADSVSLCEWCEFHEAAGKLELNLRDVFDLRWYFELPAKEVADILGISESTEARRYRDARSAVGRVMKDTLTLM